MTQKPDGIIKLHGREYKTVALRVQEFREKYSISEGWGIRTELVSVDAEVVIFRACILDPQGREVAIGFAEERRSNRGINATSALENCETSALGRALAAAGFGGSEYASADELVSALNQQRQQDKPRTQRPAREPVETHPSWSADRERFLGALQQRGLSYKAVAAYSAGQQWGRPADWTTDERSRFLDDLDAGKFSELQASGAVGREAS